MSKFKFLQYRFSFLYAEQGKLENVFGQYVFMIIVNYDY